MAGGERPPPREDGGSGAGSGALGGGEGGEPTSVRRGRDATGGDQATDGGPREERPATRGNRPPPRPAGGSGGRWRRKTAGPAFGRARSGRGQSLCGCPAQVAAQHGG